MLLTPGLTKFFSTGSKTDAVCLNSWLETLALNESRSGLKISELAPALPPVNTGSDSAVTVVPSESVLNCRCGIVVVPARHDPAVPPCLCLPRHQCPFPLREAAIPILSALRHARAVLRPMLCPVQQL